MKAKDGEMREREIRDRESKRCLKKEGEKEEEIRQKRCWMCRHSRLPQDGERDGVCCCLAGEHHICATQVPIIVITCNCHLGGVWGKDG